MFCFSRTILYLSACAALSALVGCGALLKKHESLFRKASPDLPAIQTSPEAVQLQSVLVERPIDDLLMQSLWQEVDEIGAIEPEVRKSLRENGFRVGVASSSPPRALQAMLGLESDLAGVSAEDTSKRLPSLQYVLPPNAETKIDASPFYPTCSIEVPTADGQKVKEYANARCRFHVTARRLQDGWVALEFLPEIHHGSQRLRFVATEGGWKQEHSQKINRLYGQRFEIKLNVGEMVLITCEGDNIRSAGNHFFVGADEDTKVQRLLVVRLANMGNTEPVYAD